MLDLNGLELGLGEEEVRGALYYSMYHTVPWRPRNRELPRRQWLIVTDSIIYSFAIWTASQPGIWLWSPTKSCRALRDLLRSISMEMKISTLPGPSMTSSPSTVCVHCGVRSQSNGNVANRNFVCGTTAAVGYDSGHLGTWVSNVHLHLHTHHRTHHHYDHHGGMQIGRCGGLSDVGLISESVWHCH